MYVHYQGLHFCCYGRRKVQSGLLRIYISCPCRHALLYRPMLTAGCLTGVIVVSGHTVTRSAVVCGCPLVSVARLCRWRLSAAKSSMWDRRPDSWSHTDDGCVSIAARCLISSIWDDSACVSVVVAVRVWCLVLVNGDWLCAYAVRNTSATRAFSCCAC